MQFFVLYVQSRIRSMLSEETFRIIDSALSDKEALLQNPLSQAPEEVIAQLTVLPVSYWSFDQKIHEGQIVVHKELVQNIEEVFRIMLAQKFPITSVIPIAHPRFHWDDDLSMDVDNTSAFNYRKVVEDSVHISYHAYGRAIDINPFLNPYIKNDIRKPESAIYDPREPGTISADSFIVKFFKNKGWVWGGDFEHLKDYQHFEKHS